MAKTKELTVEDKLRSLYRLQLIDSRIDDIKSVRGELPLEIEDLEDEIAGLNTRLSKLTEDVANFETEISNKKNAIEESKTLSKKYDEQQQKVRNNREFDSLTKEIEYQQLEIELAEKRIKEHKVKIEQKNEVIATTTEKLDRQKAHLDHKKSELDAIAKETQKEEELMSNLSAELSEKIDAHLLKAYKKIRSNVKNGLAVVAIERGAAGGSYFTIPPQVQIEIASRKKITIDEYSGRILVDSTLADEEKAALDSILA
ncbi:zinc ribbon domain-containing protein [Bacteroidota bacterium]